MSVTVVRDVFGITLLEQPQPPDAQDKRSVIPIERAHWEQWLHGGEEDALALVKLPDEALFAHGPADPQQQVALLS